VKLARHVICGFAALAIACAAFAQQPGGEQKLEVTHVSFLQGRHPAGGPPDALIPSTRALVMFDHVTNRLIKLPEWEKGRAENEPAAFRKGRPFEVYAQFRGTNDLQSADIWAESSDPRIPPVTERTVNFAGGISSPSR